MLACLMGDKEIVQSLLDNSDRIIELNARTNDGITAFLLACCHVVQLLLDCSDRNIELNVRHNDDLTPLMWATKVLSNCSLTVQIEPLS